MEFNILGHKVEIETSPTSSFSTWELDEFKKKGESYICNDSLGEFVRIDGNNHKIYRCRSFRVSNTLSLQNLLNLIENEEEFWDFFNNKADFD